MKYILIGILLFTNLSASNLNLKKNITSILDRLPNSTKSSIYIYNASTGRDIYRKNVDKAMIPASNTKLFTTGTALTLMGPEFELTTNILYNDSELFDGILHGDLYIQGMGNPIFSLKDLDSMVNFIKDFGIKTIEGDIIGDDSYFDRVYFRDDWIVDERANVKLPPVSALVINKNRFVVKLNSRGKLGSKLKYSLIPECSFINVDMSATVKRNRARPKINATFSDEGIKLKIKGGLRKRKSARSYTVNIDDPPLYFAMLLKERLMEAGIKVRGSTSSGTTPENMINLVSIGIKLKELVSYINKNSDNFLAECLFKSVGAYFSGMEGNSFYATQAVLSTFAIQKIIDDATAVVDGSGISRFNTITTGSIVRLLSAIFNNKNIFKDFYKSLAISGIDGTLKDRPVNNFIRGNFHGKTGTLNGVSALSGYVTGKNNETYIISIINEYKSQGLSYYKDIEDRILVELTK